MCQLSRRCQFSHPIFNDHSLVVHFRWSSRWYFCALEMIFDELNRWDSFPAVHVHWRRIDRLSQWIEFRLDALFLSSRSLLDELTKNGNEFIKKETDVLLFMFFLWRFLLHLLVLVVFDWWKVSSHLRSSLVQCPFEWPARARAKSLPIGEENGHLAFSIAGKSREISTHDDHHRSVDRFFAHLRNAVAQPNQHHTDRSEHRRVFRRHAGTLCGECC